MIFRKKFFLIIIFFLLGQNIVWSSEKIAFLDIELIINKSKPALLIIKEIEKIRDQETKKLKTIENDLKKKNEEIIKTKNLISEKELNKRILALRKEAKSFEELRIESIQFSINSGEYIFNSSIINLALNKNIPLFHK